METKEEKVVYLKNRLRKLCSFYGG